MNSFNLNNNPFLQKDENFINNLIIHFENSCNLEKNNLISSIYKTDYILKMLYNYNLVDNNMINSQFFKLIQSVLFVYLTNSTINNKSDNKFFKKYFSNKEIEMIYNINKNISFELEKNLRELSGKLKTQINFNSELNDIGSLIRDVVSDVDKLNKLGIYGINKKEKELEDLYSKDINCKLLIQSKLIEYYNNELKIIIENNYLRTIPAILLGENKRIETLNYFNN